MAGPFEGKVVIVTGSSRGIGKAIALQLARDGADIVVCARSLESTFELPGSIGETAAEVEKLGRRALAIRTDLSSDDDIRAMVDRTFSTFGRIDMLVNNAMLLGSRQKLLEGNTTILDNSYRVNVRAPFFTTQLVGPLMARNGGGIIVNISSGAARNPAPPTSSPNSIRFGAELDLAYGISKAALERFSTAYAPELMMDNIAVLTVRPGLTVTERMTNNPIRPDVDLSRAEQPEVTAKAVAFLAREPMAYTGQILTSREVVEANGL